ncbi:2'-5' RNA ligase family protein [Streptomyces sp. NPDC085665]|uniref:2'-5' RNA ligase family protein n=1 Tax=Streptomyces sp. NPDC085665 TaxID=3365735 RepID=UPI0037D77273
MRGFITPFLEVPAVPSPPPRKPPSIRHGTARAIFAVTGVVDEVDDLILPGAFSKTLATRRVKYVFHHEWKDPIGVVLDIEEWRPGDPRFASIPGGSAWPREAGALVATVQFNMRTQRGRDVYEQVLQWHENGEAQFSIGYKVPPGGASKRHDGVRIIHSLDLYEVSPVLHGAHPMTRSLEVKSQSSGPVEHKATWSAVELKAAEKQTDRGAMIALYPPRDVAEQLAQSDGTEPRHLHVTLAYLGDAAALGGHPDDLTAVVRSALSDANPLDGSVGGIGRFPDGGDGEVTWVPVDVAGLSELRTRIADALRLSVYSEAFREDHGFTPHITLGYGLPAVAPFPRTPVHFDQVYVVQGEKRTAIPLSGPPVDEGTISAPIEAKTAAAVRLEAKAAGGLDRNRGNAEQLRNWYVHGEGAARIGWGTPGDFERCVSVASKHMSPQDAAGYCNLRHHDALGIYPATHAAESKSAHAALLEAKNLSTSEAAMPAPSPLSFEQLRTRIAESARPLFDLDDESFTSVEATYPDKAVIVVCGRSGTSTYAVPYTVDGFDVDLGTPEPVELTTVAVPVGGEERVVTADEEIHARFMKPSARALDDATALITVSDATPEEVGELQPSVQRLLNALAKKGAPAPVLPKKSERDDEPVEPGDSEADDLSEKEESESDSPDSGEVPTAVPPVDLWDDEGPAEEWGTDSDDEEDEEDEEPYTPIDRELRLDAQEVKAQLAALRP